uniref:Uncharacterized protein n=1 Tax=Chromera velia CCMP2878 TaxID=1169474 RepID=A0A0G4I5H5_9ALVE|eukprot:Cvel_11138.t1-p1 / transcript=Cvel_11138.t1 / gene=Cvel_11138 / organism=Chromera_velia_CCMP2878 / gene_product=hypothetical protein / transcript_product=hypothetical protein / location=Cvel_scaffold690:50005-56788(-) / protein_length=470 / sequence_SO=supercontig / SO=protein_coding / is_pseudo=false
MTSVQHFWGLVCLLLLSSPDILAQTLQQGAEDAAAAGTFENYVVMTFNAAEKMPKKSEAPAQLDSKYLIEQLYHNFPPTKAPMFNLWLSEERNQMAEDKIEGSLLRKVAKIAGKPGNTQRVIAFAHPESDIRLKSCQSKKVEKAERDLADAPEYVEFFSRAVKDFCQDGLPSTWHRSTVQDDIRFVSSVLKTCFPSGMSVSSLHTDLLEKSVSYKMEIDHVQKLEAKNTQTTPRHVIHAFWKEFFKMPSAERHTMLKKADQGSSFVLVTPGLNDPTSMTPPTPPFQTDDGYLHGTPPTYRWLKNKSAEKCMYAVKGFGSSSLDLHEAQVAALQMTASGEGSCLNSIPKEGNSWRCLVETSTLQECRQCAEGNFSKKIKSGDVINVGYTDRMVHYDGLAVIAAPQGAGVQRTTQLMEGESDHLPLTYVVKPATQVTSSRVKRRKGFSFGLGPVGAAVTAARARMDKLWKKK